MKTCLSSTFFCVFGLAVASNFVPACLADPGDAPRVVEIGSRRELFVDRQIVGELQGTSLKLHAPQLMLPVSPPRPHGHYATVLKAHDRFQFYYRGDTKPGNHWKKGWEQSALNFSMPMAKRFPVSRWTNANRFTATTSRGSSPGKADPTSVPWRESPSEFALKCRTRTCTR